MKKHIFGSLIFLTLFMCIGSVGAVECDTLTVFDGFLLASAFIILFAISVHLYKREANPSMTRQEKHKHNGDYMNHWYYTEGDDNIGYVQTRGREVVAEDYITYESPKEAQQVFSRM